MICRNVWGPCVKSKQLKIWHQLVSIGTAENVFRVRGAFSRRLTQPDTSQMHVTEASQSTRTVFMDGSV